MVKNTVRRDHNMKLMEERPSKNRTVAPPYRADLNNATLHARCVHSYSLFCFSRERAMMSGLEQTSTILTSCHTHSVQGSQIVLPCCHCSTNQTSAECCLEFTSRGGYPMDCLGTPKRAVSGARANNLSSK